jgi:P pilus assembly chaperone PapD
MLHLFFLLLPICLLAQGDLLIYPKRLIFDGSRQSQDLSLVNNGKDTARYVISVVQIRMNEDGSFKNISEPDPGQFFADKNFRFFPRRVTLGPNEAQTVKVQLTNYRSLAAGEYRSHLYFRAEAENTPPAAKSDNADTTAVSLRILPVYGISIPVLIRSGEPTVNLTLSDLRLVHQNAGPVVQMNINRSGNMSAYGDITIHHVAADGTETLVAQIKGIAVYAPNASRRVQLKLQQTGVDYQKGSLHVVYTELSGKVRKVAQGQVFLR